MAAFVNGASPTREGKKKFLKYEQKKRRAPIQMVTPY